MRPDPVLAKAPTRNCTSAARWRVYYASRADTYQRIADALEKNFPEGASFAAAEAARFRKGAIELQAGTHRNQVNGAWK